jgi:hypothetical protein
LSRLATFRSALDDREAKAAALQQQNQQAAQPLPPLPLQYDIQVRFFIFLSIIFSASLIPCAGS